MKKPPLVLIEWVDSQSCGSWVSREEAEKDTVATCKTVGWLVKKNREVVTTAASCSSNDNYGDRMSMPRSVVKSIKVLKEVRK